jgi:hypothetical protein
MNCYISVLIGIGMLFATFITCSASKEQNERFKEVLSKEQINIFNKILTERRNLYIQGLLFGFFISYFLLRYLESSNDFYKISFFIAIAIPVSVLYYLLMPKSDYMLNHLRTVEQNKAWLKYYKNMKQRYTLGILFGILSAIPIAYSFC